MKFLKNLNNPNKHICRSLVLFLLGGVIYYFGEVIARGFSHWSMIIVGGLCYVIMGALNEFYTFKMSMISQMFLSALFITLMELISGGIVNLLFNWHVWDYSDMPYNFHGQICLLFSNLWFVISCLGIMIDDWMRYFLFNEERPKYKWL